LRSKIPEPPRPSARRDPGGLEGKILALFFSTRVCIRASFEAAMGHGGHAIVMSPTRKLALEIEEAPSWTPTARST
jgi:hypothetical protein